MPHKFLKLGPVSSMRFLVNIQIPSVLVAIGGGLAVWGTGQAKLQLTEWGIITSFPLAFYLGVSCFVIAGAWPNSPRLTVAASIILVAAALYASPLIVEGVGRFPASFYYARTTDYIMRVGYLDPRLDIFQNWPGAMLVYAILNQVSGGTNLLWLMEWTPFVHILMYLPALLM